MYSELIKQLAPKPQFNLKWYNEKDLYSDGDVEDTIIQIIASNEPENYIHEICKHYNWPTYYHLTCTRQNILNWYNFDKDGDALEIGCGLGAITSLLCDKCKSVTAVELSKRRATATLLRCREKENLEIIVGNLNDIEFDKKFDYITLIGVLEYQGSYTDTGNPYQDFLVKIKSLLKPNGKLLIAIENQYGLKYWCGASEDHTGIPFEGMNQYTLSSKKVRTFSKKGLEQLIKSSGFTNTYFYYPQPDYKLPKVIYSEDYLPKNIAGDIINWYYIPTTRGIIADEQKLYEDIISNGTFEFFSNSFLVECTDSNSYGNVKYASLCHSRAHEYKIGTKLANNKFYKFPLNSSAQNHIEQIVKNENALQAHHLHTINSYIDDHMAVSEFFDAPSLLDTLIDANRSGDAQLVYDIWDKLYSEILQTSNLADESENILYTMGIANPDIPKEYGKILKIGYMDMIPRNAFYKDDEFIWFDQEWILENVPANFIMYRAIKEFFDAYDDSKWIIDIDALCQKYNIDKSLDEFNALEKLFVDIVIDSPQLLADKSLSKLTANTITQNIGKLIQ